VSRSIRVPAFVKGLILAIANTIMCAAAIAIADGRSDPDVFGLVVAYGITPAVTAGALLGILAGLVQTRRWIRIAILLPPAAGTVLLLGQAFGLEEMVVLACVPTLASVLLLEHWTRLIVPSPIPAARIA
jgi:hypothetical protein